MIKRLHLESKKKLIKIDPDVFREIQRLADIYTGGNTSMWMKYAAVNHRPSVSELKAQ